MAGEGWGVVEEGCRVTGVRWDVVVEGLERGVRWLERCGRWLERCRRWLGRGGM